MVGYFLSLTYKSQFIDLFQIKFAPFYTLSRGEGAPKGWVWNAGDNLTITFLVGTCSILSVWVPAGGGTFWFRPESTQRCGLEGR